MTFAYIKIKFLIFSFIKMIQYLFQNYKILENSSTYLLHRNFLLYCLFHSFFVLFCVFEKDSFNFRNRSKEY